MKKIVLICAMIVMVGVLSGCVQKSQKTPYQENPATVIEDSKTKSKEQETPQLENSAIRDSTKEALDSYEKFIDEYVAFMKKYASSNDTTSLLMDYMQFTTQYVDTVEKMEQMEDELNDAELIYYNEVMLRCSQKLLTIY